MKESTPILFEVKDMVGDITLEPLEFLISIRNVRNVLQSQEVFLMDVMFCDIILHADITELNEGINLGLLVPNNGVQEGLRLT